jgi:hypothetical protein
MLEAVDKAHKTLTRKGHDITVADIQAILWYYEKRLYGDLGAVQTADISYEEAAQQIVDDRSGGQDPQDQLVENIPVGEEPFVTEDLKREVKVGLSAAIDPTHRSQDRIIPGLANLFSDAKTGDVEAITLINEIGRDSLDYLMGGLNSVEIAYNNGVGYFDGDTEPSLGLDVKFNESERGPVMAALAKFADNFIQDEIHVRQPSTGEVGKVYEDGSYNTQAYEITLTEALPRDEIFEMMNEAGLYGLTSTDTLMTLYYVGDVTNEEAVNQFNESVEKAIKRIGKRQSGINAATQRLWPYGDGESLIGYDTITGELRPATEANPATVQRIAARIAGRDVKPVQQAKEITPEQRELQSRIRDAYEALPINDLDNPTVRRAYEALAEETIKQYNSLPIKPYIKEWDEKVTLGGVTYPKGEPYPNSNAMRDDIMNNNRMVALATTPDAFGPEGITYDDHPLLRDTGQKDLNGNALLVNDMFRIIHDYYAHTLSPTSFGPIGEEAGWKNHMSMTSDPWARWALTTETRGQNSWVNFREEVQDLKLADRGFAIQKVGLLPLEFVMTGDPAVDDVMDAINPDDYDTLFQEDRGQLQITDEEMIVRLGQASDRSTFLHESAHMFLEMEKSLARDFGVNEDRQAILDWLEVESFDAIGTEQHEKFAETFEVYLMEGKSPSVALRQAFDNFKMWLKRIYQLLTKDPLLARADLNEDIRGVFDRILATDEEIEYVKSDEQYQELFRSQEQAGMTDEEWVKYQKTLKKRDNKAKLTLEQKVIKEYRDRMTKDWKDEKKALIDEEKERLLKEPNYAIMSDAKEFPMDYHVLKEVMDWKKQPGKFIGRTKGDGIDPQEYAEMYGYGSIQSMVEDILEKPSLNEASDVAAEQRMLDKYGDMLNDGTIEEEARAAMHNEEQANVLLQEIKALKGKKGDGIKRDMLKAESKRIILSMKFSDIQPSKYYRNEIKAAKNATSAKNADDKLKYKIQQLTNHYLYVETVKAKEQMKRDRKYIRGVQNRTYSTKQVHAGYIQNMKAIASLYDLRDRPEKIRKMSEVIEWYNTQIADENQFIDLQLLDPTLLMFREAWKDGKIQDLNLPTFDDMTAEDISSVVAQLKHLRHVGGQLSDEVKAELAHQVESLVESTIDNGGKDWGSRRGIPEEGEGTRKRVSHMMNKLPSLRNLMRKLDGFEDGGVAFDVMYEPIDKGNSHKMKLQREIYDRFKTEFAFMNKLKLNRVDHKSYRLESGLSLEIHSEARFMMALYWGTESSRDAIRDGYGVTDTDVMNILGDLSNDQLQMLNNVWKVNESVWPELSTASVKQYGVAPPKLEATPYTVNGVKLSGGHMRLFYDSSRLEMKRDKEEAGKLHHVMPTKAGSLHARVGAGDNVPLLDLNNISRSMDDNIHFIAFADVGDKMASIINNKEVKAAIERKHGDGFYKALIENVESITANRAERASIPAIANMFKLVRRAATMKHLAWSVRNSVQQITAVPIAMQEVGAVPFIQAMQRYATPETHKDVLEFVDQRSEFMRDRAAVVNKEAATYLRTLKTGSDGHLTIGGGKFKHTFKIDGKYRFMYDFMTEYGFTFQTIIDKQLAYPTWIAKYEQAMDQHGDDRRAVVEADTAVAESVGSGSDLHLGGAFHSTQAELTRTLTLFGSWFNAYYQRVYKSSEGFETFDKETFTTVFTMPMIVGTMSAMLVMDYPDEDSDESWLEWTAKHTFSFMAGTVPLLRDLVSAFKFSPKSPIAPIVELPKGLVREVSQTIEGNQGVGEAIVDTAKLATNIVPIPGSGSLLRVLDFMESNAEGNESGSAPKKIYQSLVEGPDRNK